MEITLLDKASGGSTELILPIHENEDGIQWREFRAPPIPSRFSTGTVAPESLDPMQDLIFSQDDWSDGALKTWYELGDKRYLRSSGCDLRFGTAALGSRRDAGRGSTSSDFQDEDQPAAFLVTDPGCERGDPSQHWTAANNSTLAAIDGSETAPTTTPQTGDFSFRILTDGSRSSGDVVMYQTLTNPTMYRGETLSIAVSVQKAIGSSTGLKVFIDDDTAGPTLSAEGGGTYSATWNGDTLTTNRTIGAGATEVTIGVAIGRNSPGGADLFYVDNFRIMLEGGTDGTRCVGLAEAGGVLYGAFGQAICYWDDANDVWHMRSYHETATATDIIEYEGKIFVAYGASVPYRYGISSGAFTASTTAGSDKYAIHWAKARNASGALVLWKSETASTVANTVTPENGGAAWTAPIQVGEANYPITGLYGHFDSLIVGKSDGLWAYVRWDENSSSGDGLFADITGGQFDRFPSTNNFSKGEYWNGWPYFVMQQGLARWRPGKYENLSHLFDSPRASTGLGRIKLLAADPLQLWVVQDDTAPDTTTTRQPYLYSLFQDDEGKLTLHTMAEMPNTTDIGMVPDAMAAYWDGTNAELWVAGRTYTGSGSDYQATPIRWRLPDTGGPPYTNNNTATLESTGWFETSNWHGGLPDQPKAFISMTFLVEDVNADDTIKVEYGLDGAAATTTTLGTLSGTGQAQTLYFHSVSNPETNAIGRTIRFRFTFTAATAGQTGQDKDDVGNTPKMYAFGMHSTLRPRKIRTHQVDVRLSNDMVQDNGRLSPVALTSMITDLGALEDQDYPMVLRADFERDGSESDISVHLRDHQILSESDGHQIRRLLFQEVHTAA